MDRAAELATDILKNYPRIFGILMGVALHPLFSWLVR